MSKEKISNENIIAELKHLKDSKGWKIIARNLEENIKEAEKRLYGEIALKEGETIEMWQKTRSDRVEMLNLPDILIKHCEDPGKFNPELDPYQ